MTGHSSRPRKGEAVYDYNTISFAAHEHLLALRREAEQERLARQARAQARRRRLPLKLPEALRGLRTQRDADLANEI